MIGAKVWQKAEPLLETEKLKVLPEPPQKPTSQLKIFENSPKTV
jgi:hypothetical protein